MKRNYWLLFFIALAIRILFAVWAAPIIWGAENVFVHADSSSFLKPAENLRLLGTYSNDLDFEDGFFTRVPGYTLIIFLLGFLPGEVTKWIAVLQIILDSGSALLCGILSFQIYRHSLSFWTGGLLYTFYPFALFWITPTVPDTLTTFLTFSALWLFTNIQKKQWMVAVHGGALAAITLSREYLGLLVIPAAFAWLQALRFRPVALKFGLVAALTFIIVYSPWPLRNYVNHGQVILLRADSSGYRQYTKELLAAVDWMSAWTPNQDSFLKQFAYGEELSLPEHVLGPGEKAFLDELQERALECGNGIRLWGGQSEVDVPCTAELVSGFEALKASYVSRHPVRWALEVPSKNVLKILFKSELSQDNNSTRDQLARLLFLLRTVFIILAIGSAWRFRHQQSARVITLTCCTLYLFMAFEVRGVQMRYLLQADSLGLALAGALVANLHGGKFRKQGSSPETHT